MEHFERATTKYYYYVHDKLYWYSNKDVKILWKFDGPLLNYIDLKFQFPLDYLKKNTLLRHKHSTSRIDITKTVYPIVVFFLLYHYVVYVYIYIE